jgi:hypothetical protein
VRVVAVALHLVSSDSMHRRRRANLDHSQRLGGSMSVLLRVCCTSTAVYLYRIRPCAPEPCAPLAEFADSHESRQRRQPVGTLASLQPSALPRLSPLASRRHNGTGSKARSTRFDRPRRRQHLALCALPCSRPCVQRDSLRPRCPLRRRPPASRVQYRELSRTVLGHVGWQRHARPLRR